MKSSRDLTALYLALLLVVLAAGLIIILSLQDLAQELMQILALIAGAASFSSLSLVLGYARQPNVKPLIQVTFDGRRLQEKLGKVIDAEYTEVDERVNIPALDEYADDDVILALAKVRIDLERELRRLATETGAIRSDQRFDIRRSLEALQRMDKVPQVAIQAIRDILPICNRAIHGEQIDAATARRVIDIAREVMVVMHVERVRLYR